MKKYVIVRASAAGVHCGELASRDGSEVVLEKARRIWRWDTRNDAVKAFTLHEVSMIGAGSGGRVSAEVDEILVLGVCEVIPCTKQGEKALREAPEWKK